MSHFVQAYWYMAAMAFVALWVAVAGSGVVAVVVAAVRDPKWVRAALRRLGPAMSQQGQASKGRHQA